MKFGERLKFLRKNMSQKRLGEIVGVSASTIAKYESGMTKPSLKVAIKIAKVFNVKLDYLAGLVD